MTLTFDLLLKKLYTLAISSEETFILHLFILWEDFHMVPQLLFPQPERSAEGI